MVSSFTTILIPLLFVAISSVSAAPSKFTRIPPRSDHTRNPTSRALKYGVQSYNPAGRFQVRMFLPVILLNSMVIVDLRACEIQTTKFCLVVRRR